MSKFKVKPLNEQTIVITGASSGIGLATALLGAVHGANIVLVSRNATDLERIAKGINVSGGHAIYVAADVSRLADLEKVRDRAVAEFGGIDTWINNAGTSIYGYLIDTPLAEARKLFDTNFWGIVHGSTVAIPVLQKSGGVLINLGSEVSGRSIPLQGMYAATKHAVKAYTDALRMEINHLKLPIAVSLIRPTAINTPFPEHATSLLRKGSPSLPSPMFDPDVVAEAILQCAVDPQRDVFVGAPSKLHTLMDAFFPGVTDMLMSWSSFEDQSKGIDHDKKNEALNHAPSSEGKIRGFVADDKVKQTSAYTKVSTHPLLTAAAVASVVGAGYVLSKSVSQIRNPQL